MRPRTEHPALFLIPCFFFAFLCAGDQQATASSASADSSVHYSFFLNSDSVFHTVAVLASDSLEGREAGKPGQKKAAGFIARKFSSYGLQPGAYGKWFQPHPLSSSSNKDKNIRILNHFLVYRKDFFYSAGCAEQRIFVDTLCFLGQLSPDPASEAPVRDRPVLITSSSQNKIFSDTWNDRIRELRKMQPSVILSVSADLQKDIQQLTLTDEFQLPADSVPVILITPSLAAEFFGEDSVTALHTWFSDEATGPFITSPRLVATDAEIPVTRDVTTLQGENVLGFLPGTDKKEELLVISAHYDHLGLRDSVLHPGADDDASGTAALLEMARVFSKAAGEGWRPKRSILFIAFCAEEKGLLGSRYYSAYPVYPLKKTVADLNMDMLGRTDPRHDSLAVRDYIYIIGAGRISTRLDRMTRKINTRSVGLTLDYTYNRPEDPNRFYYRSDHYNFAKHRIPFVFYFNGVHSDYHKTTDTPEKIDAPLIVRRTRLVFLTAWELANHRSRPRANVKEKDVTPPKRK